MKNKLLYSLPLLLVSLLGCKKDWLEAKPAKSLVVPSTARDLQALLDNTDIFNLNQPGLSELSADNFYLTASVWQSLSSATERAAYRWAADLYEGVRASDWNYPYQQVFYANTVLDILESKKMAAQDEAHLRGSALFYRAYAFYNLAQEFAKPFDPATAGTDAGIPLRLSSDLNEKKPRASVEQVYNRIIADLQEARTLLPMTALYKTRPSVPATWAMLARVFLSMADYDKALRYADSCLQHTNTLLNFNTLNAAATNPFTKLNAEVLWHTTLLSYSSFSPSRLIVDSVLYSTYNSNDLRKVLFFRTNAGNITFKGSYDGTSLLFSGLAVNEILLIRAECRARKGLVTEAMADLNTLLQNRWKTGTFTLLTATGPAQALALILAERRKELVFRGLRWSDLRRLNRETPFAITLKRVINGEEYTLPPNHQRYVLPIPDDEIRLSGIPQNPR